MNMRSVLVTVMSLLAAVGCCMVMAGCESLDTSAADASGTTEASLSTSVTLPTQVEDLTREIVGAWAPAVEQGYDEYGPMWEFFDDGICWQSVWDPELEGYNVSAYPYLIEGDVLTVMDGYGLEQSAFRISIVDDVLTMVDIYNPDIIAALNRDY